MATFGDLRTKLRDFKIAEESTSYFEDSDLLDLLVDAAVEIAAAFRFPRAEDTKSVSDGDSSFTPASGTRDIITVSFEGLRVRRTPRADVKFMQALSQESWPRVWHYDPTIGGDVEYGPPSPTGDFSYTYLAPVHASTPDEDTDVWDGLFEEFHEVVLLRGAMKAFEMSLEYEFSSYHANRYGQVIGEFANHFGVAVPDVMRVQQAAEAGTS